MLSMLGTKFGTRHFEIVFSYFSQEIDSDMSCKMSHLMKICIDC